MIYPKDNTFTMSMSPHSLGLQNNMTTSPTPGSINYRNSLATYKNFLGAGAIVKGRALAIPGLSGPRNSIWGK